MFRKTNCRWLAFWVSFLLFIIIIYYALCVVCTKYIYIRYVSHAASSTCVLCTIFGELNHKIWLDILSIGPNFSFSRWRYFSKTNLFGRMILLDLSFSLKVIYCQLLAHANTSQCGDDHILLKIENQFKTKRTK